MGVISILPQRVNHFVPAGVNAACPRGSNVRGFSIQYIPVTYYSDGRTGNDIQYLTRDEIIADVLREYERYLSIIADERKSMMFVDKGDIIHYMKK